MTYIRFLECSNQVYIPNMGCSRISKFPAGIKSMGTKLLVYVVGKRSGKTKLWRSRLRCDDNIKMKLSEC
jgi:hypothetical protein